MTKFQKRAEIDVNAIREKKLDALMSRCVHVTSLLEPKCKAGVVYDDLASGEPKMKVLPCIKTSLSDPTKQRCCVLKKTLTREEAEAEYAEHEKIVVAYAAASHVVSEDILKRNLGKGRGGVGEVKCPCCETGTLRYRVANVNGHVHACCTTPNCVRWME